MELGVGHAIIVRKNRPVSIWVAEGIRALVSFGHEDCTYSDDIACCWYHHNALNRTPNLDKFLVSIGFLQEPQAA